MAMQKVRSIWLFCQRATHVPTRAQLRLLFFYEYNFHKRDHPANLFFASLHCSWSRSSVRCVWFGPKVVCLSDMRGSKGTFQKRFSGIRPLRGYSPPLLTESQSEKKKVFFLSGKGGYPPPLNGKSAKLFREIFS